MTIFEIITDNYPNYWSCSSGYAADLVGEDLYPLLNDSKFFTEEISDTNYEEILDKFNSLCVNVFEKHSENNLSLWAFKYVNCTGKCSTCWMWLFYVRFIEGVNEDILEIIEK